MDVDAEARVVTLDDVARMLRALAFPVLEATKPSPLNVARPEERVEEWHACDNGGFRKTVARKRGTEEGRESGEREVCRRLV